MNYVRDVVSAVELLAPKKWAFEFDKVGLQVGDPNQLLSAVMVSMDPSLAAVRAAKESGCGMLVCHHPLIFNPPQTITTASLQGKVILELAKNNIAFLAAHTNWDSARGGINDTLANLFGLEGVQDFGTGADVHSLKVVTFVPPCSEDAVVDAASSAGAGIVGNYERCAFGATGIGKFRPLNAAQPTSGERGSDNAVTEIRLEMVALESHVKAIERAIRRAHPYEEPVIEWYQLHERIEQPAGRIGHLPNPITLNEFVMQVGINLGLAPWSWGDPKKLVKKVAVVGGAADGEWKAAQRAGADVLLTGEVKQHVALEASEGGFAIIAAGHYATENPGTRGLKESLQKLVPELNWVFFEPEPGTSGRPF